MHKICRLFIKVLLVFTIFNAYANTETKLLQSNIPIQNTLPKSSTQKVPLITPSAPNINAKSYILIDVNSGKILAEKNSDQKLPPASLTKMMTLYVASNAIANKQITLKDNIRVSTNAWKTGGSRMFVKEGQEVSIEDLLKGVIVDSGNDACVAIAEHLGGSEKSFTQVMNQQANILGLKNSHFTDSTGLPNQNHYTTAKDLAILGSALIKDFPEYYHWYKQKWFTFNGIRQPNRNRLLWRNEKVDGLKTGHTNEAGFCLVSSAKQGNMRLLAVVLGSPSETARADDSERLLKYGFRFFETHNLYKANQPLAELNIYKGKQNKAVVGLKNDQYVTIPSGQYPRLSVNTKITKNLQAPIEQGQEIGQLIIQFDENIIASEPLYALENIDAGGFIKRMKDTMRLSLNSWFND